MVGSVSTVAKHVTTVSRRRQKSNNSVSTEQPDTARNEAVLYVHVSTNRDQILDF